MIIKAILPMVSLQEWRRRREKGGMKMEREGGEGGRERKEKRVKQINLSLLALLKQKDELEQLTEKKLQLHLQEQEQKIWREAQKKVTSYLYC